jgi:hypothetical protein
VVQVAIRASHCAESSRNHRITGLAQPSKRAHAPPAADQARDDGDVWHGVPTPG